MGLFDIFKSKNFDDLFEEALEREMTKPRNENEIYSEITNCYFTLLRLLNIDSFNSFKFAAREDCRRVVVDGNEYDFDNEFHHNDSLATEMLCTIDCLIADLENDVATILGNIETKISANLSH